MAWAVAILAVLLTSLAEQWWMDHRTELFARLAFVPLGPPRRLHPAPELARDDVWPSTLDVFDGVVQFHRDSRQIVLRSRTRHQVAGAVGRIDLVDGPAGVEGRVYYLPSPVTSLLLIAVTGVAAISTRSLTEVLVIGALVILHLGISRARLRRLADRAIETLALEAERRATGPNIKPSAV